MSRRLLRAFLAPLLVAASAAAVSTSAYAHYRGDRPCVVTIVNTWLNDCYGCDVPVHRNRAFRVVRQDRDRLWVWNGHVAGWLNFRAVKLEDERRCWAARI